MHRFCNWDFLHSGTKHHRFIPGLTFLATTLFFRHKKRLRKIEHLQDQGFISSELYFSLVLMYHCTTVQPFNLRKTRWSQLKGGAPISLSNARRLCSNSQFVRKTIKLIWFLNFHSCWILLVYQWRVAKNVYSIVQTTDYGRPLRKSPSLHGRKSNPNPKFLGMAEASAQIFGFLWFMTSLGVCSPWSGLNIGCTFINLSSVSEIFKVKS